MSDEHARTFFRPLPIQPPDRFRNGDVAPITDGARWAISRFPDRVAWPPGERNLIPPYSPGRHITQGTVSGVRLVRRVRVGMLDVWGWEVRLA